MKGLNIFLSFLRSDLVKNFGGRYLELAGFEPQPKHIGHNSCLVHCTLTALQCQLLQR
ncbi:hypothetical protein HPGCJGGD_0218 [Methylobacterium haplocladii]|nr:hypothetical protein HPGCJGGD_0218 [Methylobacterium haplocladii]